MSRSVAERHAESIMRAMEIRDLFDTPQVIEYFKFERERILLAMEENAGLTGDAVRILALELKHLNQLERKLRFVVESGELAAQELAKMDK